MDGYAIAGTWVIVIAIICAAPSALTWCAVQVRRGRR